MAAFQIPDIPPLSSQDIDIMRCAICGTVLPGSWGITRRENQVGIDHLLDRHVAELVANREPRPPFINCSVQDPFWFEEHA